MAPALLAGCTVDREGVAGGAGAGYLIAEIAEEVGLPAGVVNVLTADREVSELTGARPPGRQDRDSPDRRPAGRRIGAMCGERIARCTLELGGKSAAVILDDADIGMAAAMTLAGAECFLSGQVCASLTRIVVPRAPPRRVHRRAGRGVLGGSGRRPVRRRHPDGAAGDGASARPGRALHRQGHRGGCDAGDRRRPAQASRSAATTSSRRCSPDVDNKHVIAQEEIFGPVLSVIPADNDEHAIDIANDTIYGLNAAVFTPDAARAREVAGRIALGHCRPQRHDAWIIGIASAGSSSPASAAKAAAKACCPTWRPRRCCSTGRPE